VRNPYDVLGVARNATADEIKTAFRRRAAQHHPDRNPDDDGAQDRFKEVNHAYQVLSDPQKRAAYDRWGPSAFGPGAAGPPGSGFVDLSNLDGLFGDILGAMGVKTGDRGAVKQRVRLTFEEAARGCEKSVTYTRSAACDRCEGKGAEPGTASHRCPACKGRGRTRAQHGLFPLPIERFCTRCHGTGRIAAKPCRKCHGRGVANQSHEERVTFPAGVSNGSTVKVAGAGSRPRHDRDTGALEVQVEVERHPFFKRVADDVVCSVPITFSQAALGAEVEVPTLDGKLKMKVPPGTQPGHTLRLRGKGITHRVRPGCGDQLVEIQVEVPVKLSDSARELIERLGDELGDDGLPQRKSFMERVRSWFG
jgi:molecular chaperone DnaJ